MFNKITLDDYDIEYSSDNFDVPVIKRPFLSESTKSAFCVTKSTSAAVESSTTAFKTSLTSFKPSKPVPIAFKSAATSVKSSFYPMPVDKASNIKEGPKKISKRVMTIKTTNFVTKYFFVEVFLGLVLSKGGNNTRLKDMTNNYTRLISKYKEAYFEDSGYTSPQLTICSANNPVRVYPEDYTFQENSIYYDVMASPESHFKAFFRLAELSKAEQTKQFACFPLCTTFVPCCMTLDSKIIHYHVLKSKKNPKTGSKFETWGAVSLRFQRILETDRVVVSIIKQNADTSRKSPKPNTEKKVDGKQTEHIEGLGQADLKSTEGKCVLIDPGRRDLMYCMKETSTVEEKQSLIFSKNNRSKCSRQFRYLRKRTQPFVVQKVETILSRSESNSVDLKKFVQYIKTRASVKNTLYEYYENETTKSKETYFPESEFDFRVDQKCNLYYGNLFIARTHGFFPQSENFSTDSSVKPQLYATYLQTMLQQKHISERLYDSEKSKVLRLAKEMYRQPHQSN
ncbi:hypothetical protein G6F61_011303 [Rhizopus arrhizus]|nr:hypothetical protein G6F61_011303 [Rhizopus arrhizus]